jgi:hypothetical protein
VRFSNDGDSYFSETMHHIIIKLIMYIASIAYEPVIGLESIYSINSGLNVDNIYKLN